MNLVRFLYLFLPLLLIGLIGGAVASAQRFTPGEILVLFSPASPGKAAVELALAASPAELAALDPVVTSLETAAAVPLRAIRISSGNWVLVSVDSTRLTDRVAGQLRGRARVKAVEVIPLETMPGVRVSRPNGLRVQFSPGSAESGIVSAKSPESATNPLAGLIQQIGATLDLPLKGEARDNSRLFLEIDYVALTPIVMDRLKTLPGIESVQPNYTVGFRSTP